MDVKVSCVTSEEVSEKFRVVMNEIEAWFENSENRNYGGGIDRLALVAVSFSDDECENEECKKNFIKLGRYKSPAGSGYIRYLSVACAIQPKISIGLSVPQLAQLVMEKFLWELSAKNIMTPKGFDLEKLKIDFKSIIETRLKGG